MIVAEISNMHVSGNTSDVCNIAVGTHHTPTAAMRDPVGACQGINLVNIVHDNILVKASAPGCIYHCKCKA